MERLIIASNNQGKVKEIKAILAPYFNQIVSLKDAGIDIDVEETGATFYQNALIKARAVYDIVKAPVLSDDSGICVDALGGGPAVYSARYSGRGDAENNQKLLNELKRLNAVTDRERAAHFASAVVLYISPDKIISGEGRAYGHILTEPTGNNGFGYDCVFCSDDLKMSFGLADAESKNKVSHRYRALAQVVEQIKGTGFFS